MFDELFLTVLHQRIREARRATSLTQQQVADELHLTLRHYQRLERSSAKRITDPSIGLLYRLARILKVELCHLVREPTQLELQNIEKNFNKPGRPHKRKKTSVQT
ncbi:helix-turn-helix domain-containing protein [Deinococcus cellulosilyticus]|uniref:HTH cro/C1-type domain-containing protein n=1 Tax=Deinococcus cellulosilyticus (strain DSM 18568 / NBRC 106333 / KACC 11606 / 5516J-15) TaxID=1223518 RepID=A0A511NB54_DEIC1|nr:helix-turn-helix transcriptional regulator [Deinococcus cellulosilyticus]GEM50050.1 hypothetical protein DC3_56850 [Deinococcus cellulosilyticus NBRC 106333 = KACC 11606]